MARQRTPTESTLQARAEREARRQAQAATAKTPTPSEKRLRLARQIVEAHNDYDALPAETDPDVQEIVRARRAFPTADLYAMRDRAVNLRNILDRKYPDRQRHSPPVPPMLATGEARAR